MSVRTVLSQRGSSETLSARSFMNLYQDNQESVTKGWKHRATKNLANSIHHENGADQKRDFLWAMAVGRG
jgi:hypothetical protein